MRRPRQLPIGGPPPRELPRIMRFGGLHLLKSNISLTAEACSQLDLDLCLHLESRVLLEVQRLTSTLSRLPLVAMLMIPMPKADDLHQQHTLQNTQSILGLFSPARRSIALHMDPRQI
jgi:hypothetical protein